MTLQLAYQRLLAQLFEVYSSREAANIADMVIEHVTGQRKIERLMYRDLPVDEDQERQLKKITGELLTHRPIQYVLGEAWFIDMKFLVNEHVLIPRPETEELVQWIWEDIRKSGAKDISIIDIGTGSGCIPISLKKKIPQLKVSAIDLSKDALEVAKSNSIQLNADIDFIEIDFLKRENWKHLRLFDLIISNPPYVLKSEEVGMSSNVLNYEPHLALFVPNDDALLFYKAIEEFSCNHLSTGGSIYVEINEALGKEVALLFEKNGLKNTLIKKDMQGKDRMVKATKG